MEHLDERRDPDQAPIGSEQPEADALDQRRNVGPEEEPWSGSATQFEASDGDLADQARAAGPDEDDVPGIDEP